MISPMKPTRRILATAFLLAILAPATHATDRDKLVELARTARFGDALESSFRKIIRRAFPNLTAEQLACFDQIPTDGFLHATVDHLATFVDDEQLAIANDFFESPTGAKWKANLDFIISGKGEATPFNEAEKARFAVFEATPVGSQIANVRKITGSEPVKAKLDEVLNDRSAKCGVPLESAGK
jgi:hypothetical protein